MILLDDATRKRQPDAPAGLLRGEARLEDPAAKIARYSRAVVRHDVARATLRTRREGECDAPPSAAKRVDGVLDDPLHHPPQESRVPPTHARPDSAHYSRT